MSVSYIKQEKDLSRKVFDVFINKRQMITIRNGIKSIIDNLLSAYDSPFDRISDIDEVAEELEIARIELWRVRSAAAMSLSQAINIDISVPDGNTTKSFINITFNGKKISNGFKMFASGQLQKQTSHSVYGDYISSFLKPSAEMSNVLIELEWIDDGKPFPILNNIKDNTGTWYSKLICSKADDFVNLITEKVSRNAV